MSEDFKKEARKKEEKKILPSEETKEGKECPNCSAVNELEARFCAECGYPFAGGKNCPNCGAKIISPNADICEVCGEWLLKGKCKFCYADIEEGATYCAECGNPVSGIICPQCGQLSYFDFCKNCNIPLTAEAQNTVERVKNAPPREDEKFSSNQEARRYFMAQKYLLINEQAEIVQDDKKNELLMMKAYLEKVEKGKKKKIYTPLFSEKQKESIKSIEKIVYKEIERQEEERRRKEEERRRKEEEERKRREEEERKRKEEEERRRKEEEERRKLFKGWLCNAYNCLHPDGPCGCADPSQGGHWVT